MNQLDPALVAAAVVCRMRYEDVKTAVRQREQGFHHMPGTTYHDAVVAVKAARHALEHRVSRSASGDDANGEGQAGGGSL